MGNDQRPEVKFKFVFLSLQMFCFSNLCGPNEQKFGELLTLPKVITPSKNLPNLSIGSWKTQHLKEKKHKPKFEFRTVPKKDRAPSRPQISFTKSITRLGNGEVKVRAFVIVFSSSLVRGRAVRKRKSTNFQGLKNPKSVNYNYDMHQRSYWRGSNECIRTNKY